MKTNSPETPENLRAAAGGGRITIREFAKLANTSTATISRVLSDKPGVSEKERKRILQLADKVGYRPNKIAQNLALQKSHVLGLIAADLTNSIYVSFFRSVQHTIQKLGYQVLIADSELSAEKEIDNIRIMQQHLAEGLIIFPVHDWNNKTRLDHLLELKLRRMPFVIVGRIEGYGFDSVTSEETNTAYRLASHLLDLGHRRIAFVGAEETNRCIVERLEGVRKALADRGLPLDPEHVIEHQPGWPDRMIAMLQQRNRPTALVIINDVCSLIAYRPLLEAGFRIPDNLSIVTFGNNIWAQLLKPSLTSTAENFTEVANESLDILLARIDNSDAPPVQRLVPQEIIVRHSTAPPPQA